MRTAPSNVIAAAQAADKKWGVFASVSLGQYALESAWGTKVTGRYNFFGIKAGAAQDGCWVETHEEVHGKLVPCHQRFRNFTSVAEAFDEHARLIATDARYKAAMAHKDNVGDFVAALTPVRATDPNYHLSPVEVAFVNAMGPVYATDHLYASKLLELISEEDFEKYDNQPQEKAP